MILRPAHSIFGVLLRLDRSRAYTVPVLVRVWYYADPFMQVLQI